jgi:hypothetical protein
MKGYAILSVHHISHGPGHVQAECGDARWRVRRRGPRSCCGASFCAHVGSTRSWSKHAHIQGFKGVVWAYTTAGIERGRRGARRRAGTGAAACAEGKNDREDDANHVKKSRACLQAMKRRWRRRPTSVMSLGGAPTAEEQGTALSSDEERSLTQGRHG